MVRVRRASGETCRVEYRDGKVTKRYSHNWKVELEESDPKYSAAEIASLPGVPRPGLTTYRPRDGVIIPFAICRSAVPKSEGDGRRLWVVACDFEKDGDNDDESNDENDPESLAPRIEPFCDGMEVPLLKDFDGKEILDPFERLYETPVMAQVALPGVRVTRYVKSFDEQTLAYWKYSTNESTWRNQPQDAWYIRDVQGKPVEFAGYQIGQLTFEIVSNPIELNINGAIKRVGWQAPYLLQSEVYIDSDGKEQPFRFQGGGSSRVHLVDKDGNPSDTPKFVCWRKTNRRNFSLIV